VPASLRSNRRNRNRTLRRQWTRVRRPPPERGRENTGRDVRRRKEAPEQSKGGAADGVGAGTEGGRAEEAREVEVGCTERVREHVRKAEAQSEKQHCNGSVRRRGRRAREVGGNGGGNVRGGDVREEGLEGGDRVADDSGVAEAEQSGEKRERFAELRGKENAADARDGSNGAALLGRAESGDKAEDF
jgi:hypothetical protein